MTLGEIEVTKRAILFYFAREGKILGEQELLKSAYRSLTSMSIMAAYQELKPIHQLSVHNWTREESNERENNN